MLLKQPVQHFDFTEDGRKREVLTLDPFGFIINSIAMGDVLACAPVVKYMADRFYTDPSLYRVVAKKAFRSFFPFVPDSSFNDFDEKGNFWNIPENWAVGVLNRKNDHRMVRNTPKKLQLSQYAGLMMCDELIPLEHLNYIPLEPVDISKFKFDFSNSVIIVSTFRDHTRTLPSEYILEIAKRLNNKGVTPVFVGKTDPSHDVEEKESAKPKSQLPDDASEYGLDLRNRTNLNELATIMSKAKAVIGVDSGPIHLAGTTSTPIICGYTSVSAELRIPVRKEGKTYAIVPDLECINCESRWRSNYWNFENCHKGTLACVNELTPNKYIEILETLI